MPVPLQLASFHCSQEVFIWPDGVFNSRFHFLIGYVISVRDTVGQWAEFLFCTGTGQPRPPQSPAALQAGSGEPKARVLTWHLSMGV